MHLRRTTTTTKKNLTIWIGTVAIDLSKAFDCLPHDLMLEKLRFYGLSDQALLLMRSYLSSCHQRVMLGGVFSTWKEV